MLPQFFRDKRHERVKQLQQRVEEFQCLLVSSLVNRLSISRLDHFQIPAWEFVPEQFVNCHQGFAQTIFTEQVIDFGSSLRQHRVKPRDSQLRIFRLFDFCHIPAFYQAEGIPDLIIEVTSLFTQRVIKQDIVSSRSRQHHTHTDTIGSVLLDQFQRIRWVTQRLRHLSANLIAHNTGEIDIPERHIAHIFITGHDHTCYPEEDDIRSGYQNRSRIIILDFFISRIVDTIKQWNRPQPRREPCIQTIFILTQIFQLQRSISGLFLCKFQSFFRCFCHYITAFRQEISRNPVSPPQLTADTPVLDILQPVTIRILIFRRIEFQLIIHDRRQGHICKVLHLQEPLHRQLRFDSHIGTFRETNLVGVCFYLFQ